MTQTTRIGLCAHCAHARRIENRRGSVFLFCELSSRDPRFSRYPPLPVRQCAGYTKSARADELPPDS
jgi:hypothetical protein